MLALSLPVGERVPAAPPPPALSCQEIARILADLVPNGFFIPSPRLCWVCSLRSLPGAGAGQEGTRDAFLSETDAWRLPRHPDPTLAWRRGLMAGDTEDTATLVPHC